MCFFLLESEGNLPARPEGRKARFRAALNRSRERARQTEPTAEPIEIDFSQDQRFKQYRTQSKTNPGSGKP